MTDERSAADLVVAAADVEPEEYDRGRRTFRQRRLGKATDSADLGTSLYELEPGDRTWPAHYHAGNEEAIFVLDGGLTLWLGSGGSRTEQALSPGDYVALPAGPTHAHEVEATGEATARFLVVSTMNEPDFTVQPEHRKVYLVAGDPPGEYADRYLSTTLDLDAAVDYWDDVTGDPREGDSAVESADVAEAPTGLDAGPAASPAVSPADREWDEYDHGEHQFRRTRLGAAAGGEALGASLYEVPSGKHAFLPHYHAGNAEALYVLDGGGTATLGAERDERALAPDDYVALPRGEAGYHDVRAGDRTLRYLAFSTMNEPDVTVYPDDGKVGLFAGSAPGGDRDDRTLSTYLDADAEVPYWD